MNNVITLRKLSAVLLSVVVTLCLLPATAFAYKSTGPTLTPGMTEGSLTIQKTDGNENPILDTSLEYTVYKVATITQTSGSTVGVQYILDNGIEVTSGGSTVVGNGTATVPSGVKAADFDAASLANSTKIQAVANTAGDGELVFNNLPLGLYLVAETVTPAGVAVSNDFLVSIPMSVTESGASVWDYDVIATPKNTVFDGSVAKTIDGGTLVVGDDADDNVFTASLGETVTYKITATLPSTFEVTPYTTYTITDTAATGLVIDTASIAVKVGAATLIAGTDYTLVSATASGFEIELITDAPTGTTAGSQSSHLVDGAEVVVTYDAMLSPNATATSFVNEVEVNYAYNTDEDPVDPDDPVIPVDPPPTIKTYNYALQKVDGDDSNAPLSDASFVIMNASGTSYLTWSSTTGWGTSTNSADAYTVTSDSAVNDAIVSFNGLKEGSYQIVETIAPSGYAQLIAPIGVTIDVVSTTAAASTPGYSIQVINTLANIFELPGTGSMGIYLFTIGGVLLIIGAAALFMRNRRKMADLG